MKQFKKLLIITAISLPIVQNAAAQVHHYHYNVWFRGTLSTSISKKFTIDNELQHRRQNGFESENMFDKNLMYTYRNWVHYKHNEDVQFSISPFAYFSNYKIIQNETDEVLAPNSEIRFSAALELKHLLVQKLYVVDRSALEYRIFNNQQANVTRLRNKLGLQYEITKNVTILVFDEHLFNVKGATINHFFDHDRLGFNLGVQSLPFLKIDIGYLHITRLPISGSSKIQENNFFLNIIYQIHTHEKKSDSLS